MQLLRDKAMGKSGAPVRTRTGNQLIKSQLLYQLSYRGNQKNGSILIEECRLSKRQLDFRSRCRGISKIPWGNSFG